MPKDRDKYFATRVKTAKHAISEVFNDTGVSQEKTRAGLEELRDEVQMLLDALGENKGAGTAGR